MHLPSCRTWSRHHLRDILREGPTSLPHQSFADYWGLNVSLNSSRSSVLDSGLVRIGNSDNCCGNLRKRDYNCWVEIITQCFCFRSIPWSLSYLLICMLRITLFLDYIFHHYLFLPIWNWELGRKGLSLSTPNGNASSIMAKSEARQCFWPSNFGFYTKSKKPKI